MTAIVGLVHAGRVWIGGDSAGGLDISTARADEKVFTNGAAVFGFTTSFRMGQLLRHSLVLPPQGDVELERWMSTTFVDAVRECLKAGGYASTENTREAGGTFLVGIGGRLFAIYGDYQVAEQIEPWWAVGCGYEVAIGSLWTSAHVVGLCDQPETRIRLSLQAAANYCSGVRGPFKIIATEQT